MIIHALRVSILKMNEDRHFQQRDRRHAKEPSGNFWIDRYNNRTRMSTRGPQKPNEGEKKKKRANELKGQSTKIIQSGEHRRKKKFDKKWTDSQRPVGQYHKFLYTMIIVLEEEEKEICAQTYLKKSCLKIFQIW